MASPQQQLSESLKGNSKINYSNELDKIFHSAKEWVNNLRSELDQVEVVDKALEFIQSIQRHSTSSSSDLISISLNDIKIFNSLVNVLIAVGIYPSLSENILPPLEQRFERNQWWRTAVPTSYEKPQLVLEKIVTTVVRVLATPGDVTDLLLLGTYTGDFLAAAIEYAYSPESESMTARKQLFVELTEKVDTYSLYVNFSTLLQSSKRSAPQWFTKIVSRQLALLPLVRSEKDGVKGLVEFVSGLRNKEQVSLSDLEHAVTVLKSPPRGVPKAEYAKKVSPQLFTLVAEKPSSTSVEELILSVVNVIYGLYEQPETPKELCVDLESQFIDRITPQGSPISETNLDKGLQALYNILQNPHLIMLDRLHGKLLPVLWVLYTYLDRAKRPKTTIQSILISMIKKLSTAESVQIILKSLLNTSMGDFTFGPGPNGGIEVRQVTASIEDSLDVFTQLDHRVNLFVDTILKDVDNNVISGLFVYIIRQWLIGSSNHHLRIDAGTDDNPFKALVNVKILEKLSQEPYKSKLLKEPSEIIDVLGSIISQHVLNMPNTTQDVDSDDEDADADSDDEDENTEAIEIVSLSLSLISGIAMEFEIGGDDRKLLATLSPQLHTLAKSSPHEEIQYKAKNALQFIGEAKNVNNTNSMATADSAETLKRALESLKDPIVPVKAYGLSILRDLITNRDPVLDFQPVIQILLDQLTNDDSFIYLNSIKTLETLSSNYGSRQVVPILLDHYTKTSQELDIRLRLGEVLLKIIQKQDKTMDSAITNTVIENLIKKVINKQNDPSSSPQELRMSAMSIVSMIIEVNPFALSETSIIDSVDCALGILTFEQRNEESVIRRSAIYLIYSILNLIPKNYLEPVKNRLENAQIYDEDSLVRSQATSALEFIS